MGLSTEVLAKLKTTESMLSVDNEQIADVCETMHMCEDQAEDFEINHQDHVNFVNAAGSSWTAGANNRFLSGDY